jgi:hypothetical protein
MSAREESFKEIVPLSKILSEKKNDLFREEIVGCLSFKGPG